MINIACLKYGTKIYGPEYVNRLFYAIRRNTSLPFKLHCFTERPEGIHPEVHIIPLNPIQQMEGWWHKLQMFSSECPIKGRIHYFDLDTLITGNLDAILSHNKGFVVLHDFFRVRMPTRKDRFGLGKDAVGSGVLSWESGKHTHIWETFNQNPQAAIASLRPHGDQKWIEKHQKERLYWQDLFSGKFVSFKVHCRNGLPKNACVVCYHGAPSIPQSINNTTQVQGYTIKPTPWVKKYWKDEDGNTKWTTHSRSKEAQNSKKTSASNRTNKS